MMEKPIREPEPISSEDPMIRPLPADAILLHIGIHKTGTTALQGAASASREPLSTCGTTYPGRRKDHHAEAMALVDTKVGWETVSTPRRNAQIWRKFADTVSQTGGRVLISSEFFCQANDKQAQRAVGSLGADRVHVVLGLRPLAKLLPSSWQQYLKNGRTGSYESWLKHVLADPPGMKQTPSFWLRNDIPAVLDRWAELIGPDRITAVMVDPNHRDRMSDTVCTLLDLPPRLLSAQTQGIRSNRAMTGAEAELIRQVNVVARRELSSPDYIALVRNGAARRMVEGRTPGPLERELGLPAWTAPRLAEIGATHLSALRSSGVHIVGDPSILAAPADTSEPSLATELPIDAAVQALLGTLLKVSTAKGNRTDERLVRAVKSRKLAEVALVRARAKLRLGTRGSRRRAGRPRKLGGTTDTTSGQVEEAVEDAHSELE